MNKCHHPASWQTVGGNFQGLDPSPISRTHRKGVGGMDTRHLAHIVLAQQPQRIACSQGGQRYCYKIVFTCHVSTLRSCLGDADLNQKVKTNHKDHNIKKKIDETSWVFRQLGVVLLQFKTKFCSVAFGESVIRQGSMLDRLAACSWLGWPFWLWEWTRDRQPRAQGLVRRVRVPGCPASSPNPMVHILARAGLQTKIFLFPWFEPKTNPFPQNTNKARQSLSVPAIRLSSLLAQLHVFFGPRQLCAITFAPQK